MMIDAHQHFWQMGKFDYSWMDAPPLRALKRDYLPEHLEPLIRKVGIEKTIFVQTQHNLAETRWVLDLAGRHDFIAGVVGWVDLASPECEAQLLALKGDPKFVGVRHITQDEPDVDFIIRPNVLRGLRTLERRGVPFDLLFFTKHLHHARALGAMLPDLPMVIDHLAKPKIKDGRMKGWREDLKAAAACPNIFCKLSGMVTEAHWEHWTAADLKPYVHTALDCFTPRRCMFGSDWPVCTLAGRYEAVYHALVEALGPISESERAAIFGETAAGFYGIKSKV